MHPAGEKYHASASALISSFADAAVRGCRIFRQRFSEQAAEAASPAWPDQGHTKAGRGRKANSRTIVGTAAGALGRCTPSACGRDPVPLLERLAEPPPIRSLPDGRTRGRRGLATSEGLGRERRAGRNAVQLANGRSRVATIIRHSPFAIRPGKRTPRPEPGSYRLVLPFDTMENTSTLRSATSSVITGRKSLKCRLSWCALMAASSL